MGNKDGKYSVGYWQSQYKMIGSRLEKDPEYDSHLSVGVQHSKGILARLSQHNKLEQ